MAQIKWLTGLKGLLCIFIVLYHYTCRYTEIYGTSFFFSLKHGAEIGVTAFMLISGFLTLATIEKLYSDRIKWIKNKYLRLWKPYTVCLLITFTTLMVFGLPGRDNITFIDFLKDLTMLPFIAGHIEGATWYVMSLVQYLLIIFLVSTLMRFEDIRCQWFILLVFVLCTFVKLPITHYVEILMGRSLFYMGGAIFLAIKNNKYVPLLILYFLLVRVPSEGIWGLSATISIVLLLYFNSSKHLTYIYKILEQKFFVYIGGLSYVWYLIHQNVGYTIIYHLQDTFSKDALPYIALMITFSISVLVNYLIKNNFSVVYFYGKSK